LESLSTGERTAEQRWKSFKERLTAGLKEKHGVCPGCKRSWKGQHHALTLQIPYQSPSYVALCGTELPLSTEQKALLSEWVSSGRGTVDSLHAEIQEALFSIPSRETPTPGVRGRGMGYTEKYVKSKVERGALNYWDSWTYQP